MIKIPSFVGMMPCIVLSVSLYAENSYAGAAKSIVTCGRGQDCSSDGKVHPEPVSAAVVMTNLVNKKLQKFGPETCETDKIPQVGPASDEKYKKISLRRSMSRRDLSFVEMLTFSEEDIQIFKKNFDDLKTIYTQTEKGDKIGVISELFFIDLMSRSPAYKEQFKDIMPFNLLAYFNKRILSLYRRIEDPEGLYLSLQEVAAEYQSMKSSPEDFNLFKESVERIIAISFLTVEPFLKSFENAPILRAAPKSYDGVKKEDQLLHAPILRSFPHSYDEAKREDQRSPAAKIDFNKVTSVLRKEVQEKTSSELVLVGDDKALKDELKLALSKDTESLKNELRHRLSDPNQNVDENTKKRTQRCLQTMDIWQRLLTRVSDVVKKIKPKTPEASARK